eukprot:1990770-Amphidinium_carterae.1
MHLRSHFSACMDVNDWRTNEANSVVANHFVLLKEPSGGVVLVSVLVQRVPLFLFKEGSFHCHSNDVHCAIDTSWKHTRDTNM